MKTFLKVFGIVIVIVLGLMILTPLLFHKQIMDTAITEANKQVNAKINFTDYSLSLFRSFPNFNLKVENLSIANTGDFEGDTLASVASVEISIGLFSVFNEGSYEIKKIEVIAPTVFLAVDMSENVNWDIAKAGDDTHAEPGQSGEDFNLLLRKLSVKNASLIYKDEPAGIFLKVKELNHFLSGDLSADFTALNTKTNIGDLVFVYEGIRYINHAHVKLDAVLDADLKNSIYTFKRNELNVNDLLLKLTGSVAMLESGYDLMLTFNAPDNNFKSLLSLVPAIYRKDFESVETKGKFHLDGAMKGEYNEAKLPGFMINLKVENAMFKYPELPAAVRNILVDAKIDNPGGDADNTVVNISELSMNIADNPLTMRMELKNPVSDPYIDGKINGTFELGSIKEFYPLSENESMSGLVTGDVTLKGALSFLENEKYEDFVALGSVLAEDIEYKSPDVPKPVHVKTAQLNFSPAYLDLVNLNASIGESDLRANGKIKNFMAYALSDGILLGDFSASSDYLNLNELLPDEEEETVVSDSDTTDPVVFKVPGNIDFRASTMLKRVLFQDMDMQDVTGTVEIKDESVRLQNIKAGMFGGQMTVNGTYSTKDTKNALVDMGLKVEELNIADAFNAFSFLKKYAPIARFALGRISSNFNFSSALNKDYFPVFPSVNGAGNLISNDLVIENAKSLNLLSESLDVDLFKKIDLDKVNLSFDIVEGKMNVKPFDINFGNTSAVIHGSTSFDQSIDYTMDLKVPRGSFGQQANEALNSLLSNAKLTESDISMGDYVNLAVRIGGTTTQPKIMTDLASTAKNLSGGVKDKVTEELKKKQEDLKKQISAEKEKILKEADNKAEQIMNTAKEQVSKLKQEAQKAADLVNSEAEKQGNQLIAEGKKKGFLAEAAAKKAAEKLRKEAKIKADQLIMEADKKSEDILKKAKQQGDKIRNDAANKAENL